MTNLKKMRKALKPYITSAGYLFAVRAKDWSKGAVITAEVRSFHGKFAIYSGVDHTLPEEERNRLWKEHGQRLEAILRDAGFSVDLETFGGDYRAIVVS